MVYCRYCGTQNRNGTLKCINCGKPLSLIPNDSQSSMQSQDRGPYLKKNNQGNNYNNYNYHRSPIKYRYMEEDQKIDNFRNSSKYPNNPIMNQNNNYHSQNYMKEHVKTNKNSVEWDVVIATALMVIILTAILQRVFPSTAIFISLLIGLIYILIATKSKSSLFKAIPLTIIAILAISAYFSI